MTDRLTYRQTNRVIHLGASLQKRRGNDRGGLNGCTTKEKITFFNVRKKVPMATKPRGGGGLKALVAGPLRKEPSFLRLPLSVECIS